MFSLFVYIFYVKLKLHLRIKIITAFNEDGEKT